MSLSLPLGISNFRQLRELGLAYVDKTGLICDLLDRPGAQVVLLPRPRRYGKTLNLSMLRCFFERQGEDLSALFEGLFVWNAGAAYRAHFQRYPVIDLTFKEIKASSWEHALDGIRRKIQALFLEHRELLDSGALSAWEMQRYEAILDGSADLALYERALLDLSGYLHGRHGERVIILVDEYDQPLHAGYVSGYLREILDFTRVFLGAGLKDNPHLQRAVLTGTLRIARESIFSGLNHLAVYSLLRREFRTAFGFTEAEVEALLERAGRRAELPTVRSWYNGYVFGGEVVYNPWSVISYLASEDRRARPYWVSTSTNELIQELLEHHAFAVQAEMETLLAGGAIEQRLDENVVLWDLRERPSALWPLLVFSGYLKAEESPGWPEDEEPPYLLSIPNREVRQVYTATFSRWLETRLRRQGGSLDRLLASLFAGDADGFARELQAFVIEVLSYHDLGGPMPERIYQVFLVGLLSALAPSHQVRSNRESGLGRPDVLIRPLLPGRPGVILELKVAGQRTLEEALDEGLSQIASRDYAAELRAAGAAPVHALAVAFDGKIVRARAAPEGTLKPIRDASS
ncbi:AAA family ATPase [Sorangium sp. So ce861]|uniref:AAA family ATPase n=1 Tax=Sorangium sp. So ce861 TaxID=3133323 RepID=UPI003F624D73